MGTHPPPRSDPRAFLEASVLVPAGYGELAAEALFAPGCTGVAFGPRSLVAAPLPAARELVRAFYPGSAEVEGSALRVLLEQRLERLVQSLAGDLGRPALELRALPPEHWAETWRKVWRPHRVARVCVVPPGRGPLPRPDDVRLALEPGAAFGTGRHATTRLALQALQRRLAPGDRVCDAGSGSGILAVAACLLGAAAAEGFDLDPGAVGHARELARDNGVADRARFEVLDLEHLAPEPAGFARGPFDGLVANLYGDLVRAHAPSLAARLRRGGWFVVTGCLAEVRPEVRAALEGAGLEVGSVATRGRWDCLEGIRRGPA